MTATRPDVALREIAMLATVLLVAVTASASAADMNGFGAPTPNLLFQLQKQNRQYPWLRVTTDSSRLTVRAGRIDEIGLGELRSRPIGPPPPDRIAWREISRIDEVKSREGRGRNLGFLLAGLAGAGLGNMIGAAHAEGKKDALIGLVVFGSLGAWQGGRFGERFQRESPWYVGTPAPAETTRATLTVLDHEERPHPAVSSRPQVSRRLLEVCARIGPSSRIRVQGDFGEFVGFAGVVGPQGMDELRGERKHNGQPVAPAPAGLVRWDQIDRVEVRGGSAAKGAVAGGVLFGALGGMVSAAAVTVANGSETPGTAFVEGALAVGACGALLGGLIGAAFPSWHRVYRRP